ncbi:MAG: hypothetical protein C4336_02400 [Armatimonadota bacterium]
MGQELKAEPICRAFIPLFANDMLLYIFGHHCPTIRIEVLHNFSVAPVLMRIPFASDSLRLL